MRTKQHEKNAVSVHRTPSGLNHAPMRHSMCKNSFSVDLAPNHAWCHTHLAPNHLPGTARSDHDSIRCKSHSTHHTACPVLFVEYVEAHWSSGWHVVQVDGDGVCVPVDAQDAGRAAPRGDGASHCARQADAAHGVALWVWWWSAARQGIRWPHASRACTGQRPCAAPCSSTFSCFCVVIVIKTQFTHIYTHSHAHTRAKRNE